MNIFDGLHSYEIVLLMLGAILFLVLLFALVALLLRGRSIMGLLPFFLVPVLMIGFPAVKKIKFDKDGLEIDKLALIIARDPSDQSAKTKLQMLVSEIKPRATESSQGLVRIARAEAVLGKPDEALATVDQALNREPQLEIAKDLKSRLQTLSSNHDEMEARHAVEANLALKR